MELIFNPCGEFWWSPEGPISQIHSPHLLVGAPGIFSNLFWFVQMLKREWDAENNGKLPHLFISSETTTWVPEFAMEDLTLGRIAALVPEFAVKDLLLGRTLMMMMMMAIQIMFIHLWMGTVCDLTCCTWPPLNKWMGGWVGWSVSHSVVGWVCDWVRSEWVSDWVGVWMDGQAGVQADRWMDSFSCYW